MVDAFPWTCPYCNRNATIIDNNYSYDVHFFNKPSKDGHLGIATKVIVCPNHKCKEYVIEASLHPADYGRLNEEITGGALLSWQLKPQSQAKTYPPYIDIPQAIIDDYNEACLIKNLSPKASATLSRRCLQGIIRDFWSISKARLKDEIDELQGKIDSTTWQAIDAVRSIGNIGAHMERDINMIVEVEPNEADLLIGIIEILLKDWYIAKHEREEHLKGIIGVAQEKKQAQQVKKEDSNSSAESD